MPAWIRTFLKTDTAVAFSIAIVWQVFYTIIGNHLLPDPDGKNILHHMILWDGGWYLTIIHDQYISNAASAAFYPLYPLIISLLSAATFHLLSYATVALFVNTVALGLSLLALFAVMKHFDIDSRLRYLGVVFFLSSPAAFFLHMFYSEAIFVAIGFWAYVFALRRKWMLVGILLGILTASRLPSLLFVGLCLLEYLRAYNWDLKKATNRSVLWFLFVPAGFIAYGTYLLVVRGNFFAMFSAYSATTDWSYQVFNPNILSTIGHGIYKNLLALSGKSPINAELLINTSIPLFMLVVLLACSLYMIMCHKGKGTSLGLFGITGIILFTLNSNLVSIHRYTLPCIVIYIALTLIYKHHNKLRFAVGIITLIMLFIQIYLVLRLFLTDSFVG